MALTTILEEQTFEFADSSEDGSGPWSGVADASIAFVVGETYWVFWDGVDYECMASELTLDGVLYPPLIGNPRILGGEDNGVPFAIMYASAEMTGTTAIYSMAAFDTATSHTVGIYQGTADEGTEEEQEGIILKDRNGNDVAYYDIETLTLDTTTEGKQQKYTKGVKAEKTVELSLADGDQTVEPDEGTLLSKVIIQRPDSLQPEIILSGHEVAGVPGAYVPITTEEKTVDLDFSAGDMTVEAESGKAFSRVSIPVPETLVPENIAKDVDIGGVVGTMEAGSGGGDGGSYVKYTLDDSGNIVGATFYGNATLACQDCTTLEWVDLTNSTATTIPLYAFQRCTALTEIVIPDIVTSIGQYAFANCVKLSKITIPSSVTSIGSYAFSSCSSLTEIVIPDTITSISQSMFQHCSALTSVTIGSGVTSIGNMAFYRCTALTEIVIPNTITSIGNSAFSGCSALTSVTIGSGVTSISNQVFYGCSALTSAIFKDTTTWYVGSSAGALTTLLSSGYLANVSTAASYLTTTYYNKYWTKT